MEEIEDTEKGKGIIFTDRGESCYIVHITEGSLLTQQNLKIDSAKPINSSQK